eukprot:CAMPEP_0169269054 /NCGR_PEP_ID=MMETSP1016-20121227/48195_1 /TAXON_ID=342587 /ORGANISM="Karlodinium micrum, Strain CCMP2283" /LENGTH=55 /DNA_ID=CAMNT_0009353939 /DNA_START=18 /DNA_END=182 /DNA_ORIENTATION=-
MALVPAATIIPQMEHVDCKSVSSARDAKKFIGNLPMIKSRMHREDTRQWSPLPNM